MTAPDLATFPPGPTEPADEQLARFTADPFGYVERAAAEHGPVFTLRLGDLGNGARDGVDSNGRWVFLTRPDQIRAMYEAPAERVSGAQANRLFFGTDEDSVGYVDGAEHRCRRARLQPGLSGTRDVTALVEDVATRHCSGWPTGRPFALYSGLQEMTAEIIVEIVCGGLAAVDRRTLRDTLIRTENAELGPEIAEAAERTIKELLDARLPGHLDRCARSGTEDLMAELIRPAPAGNLSGTAVRDEAFSLLYTGFSTTSNTLSWAFTEVLADPRVETELRSELATRFRRGMGHRQLAAALPYLDAVLRETLRLHPVSALNGVRMLTAAHRIDGIEVPAGTVLVHCAHLAQRTADVFDDPAVFRPERLLGAAPDPYELASFGGGSRMCPGRVFALREMRAIMATVLTAVDLRRVGAVPSARQEGIFMAPADRARCVVTDPDVFPGRREAAELGRDHDVIPVRRTLLLDELTPTAAFARLCGAAARSDPAAGDDAPGFLLQAATVDGGPGRYSYVGYRPRMLPTGPDPLRAVEGIAAETVAPVVGLPPFHGGAFGYLGYESARHFEPVPMAAGPAPDLPEAAFLAVDDMVVFDHVTDEVMLLTAYRPAREDHAAAVARIDEMQSRLLSRVEAPRDPPSTGGPTRWESNLTRAEFVERVQRAKEYIAAGDAFQVVLSQRFRRPLRTTALELYRRLRAGNPSPYMFVLTLGGGQHVIGASPELLVRSHGRRIWTRPLAGTRPRGIDHTADIALEHELTTNAKERAEHVMLVDLGRHDIGRVAAAGSVHVDSLMDVERFSHVMHLSSTVSGELAPGLTGLDALRSTFPAGTLSGAPKIRAMEIVAELEPERRGVYGGAVGSVGPGGQVDLAIALRTMVVAGGQVYVQAGAGIVASSDPEAEYAETLQKAAALFAAVERAEQTR